MFGVAVQADGKIVVAGEGVQGRRLNFAVARFQPDGSLDPAFGRHGVKLAPPGCCATVALQGDGKIVAGGSRSFPGDELQFALTRYDPDGSLDRSFSGDGTVKTFIAEPASGISALALQTDAKIIAAGTVFGSVAAPFGKIALARYNADGSLDTGFGTGGIVRTDWAGGLKSAGHAVAIQSNGKIVVAGAVSARLLGGSSDMFALARYQPDGSLDTTFGSNGLVTTPIEDGASASGLALQPDGKIVAAGGAITRTVGTAPEYRFALARYNSDGSLDASFGSGGKVTTQFVDCAECDLDFGAVAEGVALQTDGKLVLAGAEFGSGESSRGRFALARYNPNGSLDTSFGIDGKVRTSFDFAAPSNGDSGDVATSVDLQTDGKVVAAGFSNYGPHAERYKAALARYEADGSLDGSFGSGGKVSASLDMCRVPRVKGKRLRDARPAIQRSHCSVGRIRYRFSRRVKRKHVISQRPRPGSVRADRARVKLVVSKGARRR